MTQKPDSPQQPPAQGGTKAPGTKAVDWERIELDYRAGIKTLRQIADENGVSHPAIVKRANREAWTRDLSERIQAKADELVTKEAVTSSVTVETKLAERQIVEANARAVADVRLAHRRDVHRARSIVMRLLDELDLQAGGEAVALLEQLGELMRKPDDKGQDKRNDLYHKIISLPGRAKTAKDLGETLRVLIGLERQAYGIKDESDDGAAGFGWQREMSDAERAVRLGHLLAQNPQALAGLLGGGQ